MNNRLFLFAGILSFVSAFFVIVGLLLSHFVYPVIPADWQAIENVSETFIFLFAPVLLLPAVLAVYQLLRRDFPRLALFSLLLGLLVFVGLFFWSVAVAFFIYTFTEQHALIFISEVMLMGLWTLITAVAIYTYESKNRLFMWRRTLFYGLLFLSGLLCGLAMILYGWSLIRPETNLFLANASITVWLISYPFWLINLGFCLLLYAREIPMTPTAAS